MSRLEPVFKPIEKKPASRLEPVQEKTLFLWFFGSFPRQRLGRAAAIPQQANSMGRPATATRPQPPSQNAQPQPPDHPTTATRSPSHSSPPISIGIIRYARYVCSFFPLHFALRAPFDESLALSKTTILLIPAAGLLQKFR